MNDFINNKILPPVLKTVNSKALIAIKDGVLYSIPLMIVGSLFLLLANFPWQPIVDLFNNLGLIPIMNQAYECSFNIMSLIAVCGITYTYVKNGNYPAVPAAFIALSCFLLLQPGTIQDASNENVSIIYKNWCAGQGMVGAIIIGLCVGAAYSWFMKKNITIKMPAGVPEGVANSFASLIPACVIIFGAAIVYGIFNICFQTTFFEWIYTVLQIPLQNLTDSLAGMIIVSFLISFLWFFGIHGAAVVDGVLYGIWVANSSANQQIIDSGNTLTLANGAHIVTAQFYDQCMIVTGSCITIGIVIYMVFWAKSKQYKTVGKLSLVPSLFNINEPVLFGTPCVLNPFLMIPMILVPILVVVIQYLAIYSGICPLYTGVVVPWTTPIIISGLLVGGWKTALLQAVIAAISIVVYYPFVKKADEMAYAEEMNAENMNLSAEVEAV